MYGKLPTEILALTPGEFYLNLHIAFPTVKEHFDLAQEAKEREAKLGYHPIRELLRVLKGGKAA